MERGILELTLSLSRPGRAASTTSADDKLSRYGDDLQKLQAQCTRLKRERTALLQEKATQERDYAAKEGQLANLSRMIDNLRSERDSLQIELADMFEAERDWRTADQAGMHERDRAGRLEREVCLRKHEYEKLEARLKTIADEYEEKLRDEAGVAADLRQRIARLERKLRVAEAPKSTPRHDIENLVDLDHKNAVLKEELDRVRRHYADAQAALEEKSKVQGELSTRLECLEEEKREVSEELRAVKREMKVAQEAYAALKKHTECSKGRQTTEEKWVELLGTIH